jgi:hypothetical protein
MVTSGSSYERTFHKTIEKHTLPEHSTIYSPKTHADTHAHNQTTHTIKKTKEKSLSLLFLIPRKTN